MRRNLTVHTLRHCFATQLLSDERFKLHKEIQEHTNRIVQMDHQINDLTRQTAEQAGTIKSNRATIDFLRSTTNSLSSSNDFQAGPLASGLFCRTVTS